MKRKPGVLDVTPADPSPPDRQIAEAVRDAARLMREASFSVSAAEATPVEHGSLIEQCLALCRLQDERRPEPVRTIHHFACTGGTLICKCIAAMPNVQLLSELDPLSTMQYKPEGRPRFAPTDMALQLRQSSRGVDDDLLIRIFRADLLLIYDDASSRGQRLVLRDHAHSQFCFGAQVPDRATLRELLPPDLPVVSLLTVRDPIASYVALARSNWLTFEPATLDAYCERYLEFLRRHDAMPVVRYEDFVDRPAATMRQVCASLELSYNDGFEDLFAVFQLSGDSGRAGDRIGRRDARPASAALLAEAATSTHYRRLCERLGYDTQCRISE
jgi:hypothetical protein